MPLVFLLACLLAFVSGCGSTRVVFVDSSEGNLVRLGPDVRGRVFIWNGEFWEGPSKNKIKLPEGWYAGAVNMGEEKDVE